MSNFTLGGLAAALLGDDQLKRSAWANVPVHPDYPKGDFKRDALGCWIRWSDYGQRTEYGWQIDHYPIPQALGGRDTANNVRALHHRANATLGGLLSAKID